MMRKKVKYLGRDCIVCEEPLHAKGMDSKIVSLTRGKITCSPECSKIFTRVTNRIRQRLKTEEKQKQRHCSGYPAIWHFYLTVSG